MNIYDLELSDHSQVLLNYYIKFYKILKDNFTLPKDAPNNSDYFKLHIQIYKNLKNIYAKLKSDFCNYSYKNYRTIYKSDTKEYEFLIKKVCEKHMNKNKYISLKLKEFIKTKRRNSCVLCYKIPYKTTNISFYFFIYSYFSQKTLQTYDKYITHMLALIYLISFLTDNNSLHDKKDNNICSKNGMNIFIFMTPFKRSLQIDKKEYALGAVNVNGGFCYGCINRGEIVVYRQEEFFKVFSHELIHNYGVDQYIFEFINMVSRESSHEHVLYQKFVSNFNLSREINEEIFNIGLQESVVEFWGEFFNNVIFSYSSSNNNNLSNTKKFSDYISNFETLANIEILHSFFQSIKILNKNNLKFSNILAKNKEKNIYNNYKETSHIFSYYILKLFLIYDYKGFVNSQICLQRETTKYKIYFNNSISNMVKFLNYIIGQMNSQYILNNFYHMEELHECFNTKRLHKRDKYIMTNLRMSILEY